MPFVLDHLSTRELSSLIKGAEQRLAAIARRRPVATVRREIAAMATAQGYAISEIFFGSADKHANRTPRKRRKAQKVAPKFRDPENRRDTWSGRGRMPKWLALKVARGHASADYLIPGLARPTQKRTAAVGKKSVFKTQR